MNWWEFKGAVKPNCDYCGEPLGHSGVPAFAVLTLQAFVLDADTYKRESAKSPPVGGDLLTLLSTGRNQHEKRGSDPEQTVACWFCWTELIPQPGHRKKGKGSDAK